MNETGNAVTPAETTSRRHVIASAAIALGSLTLASTRVWAATEQEISHTEQSIHQVTVFKASCKRVYDALTDTTQFDKVTKLTAEMQSGMSLGNAPTNISREVGGTFTLFGGHIVGRHVELVPNQRIVQAWRVVDWNPGVYSIARFELAEQGEGTKLVFDHTGFPKGLAEHLASGWRAHYWETLEKFLA